MNLRLSAILVFALLVCSRPTLSTAMELPEAPRTPVRIIFDTDLDTDCDDLGALAVLHALADLGEAEILATGVSSKNSWSPACVAAVNTYYGRPDLPVGQPKGVGARLKELPDDHPVRVGYALYFGGQPRDRHVADQTTVLFAVRGLGTFWDQETKGYMDLNPDMTFQWRYDRNPGQSHLLKRMVNGKPMDREVEQSIEALMLQQPAK